MQNEECGWTASGNGHEGEATEAKTTPCFCMTTTHPHTKEEHHFTHQLTDHARRFPNETRSRNQATATLQDIIFANITRWPAWPGTGTIKLIGQAGMPSANLSDRRVRRRTPFHIYYGDATQSNGKSDKYTKELLKSTRQTNHQTDLVHNTKAQKQSAISDVHPEPHQTANLPPHRKHTPPPPIPTPAI